MFWLSFLFQGIEKIWIEFSKWVALHKSVLMMYTGHHKLKLIKNTVNHRSDIIAKSFLSNVKTLDGWYPYFTSFMSIAVIWIRKKKQKKNHSKYSETLFNKESTLRHTSNERERKTLSSCEEFTQTQYTSSCADGPCLSLSGKEGCLCTVQVLSHNVKNVTGPLTASVIRWWLTQLVCYYKTKVVFSWREQLWSYLSYKAKNDHTLVSTKELRSRDNNLYKGLCRNDHYVFKSPTTITTNSDASPNPASALSVDSDQLI